MPKFQSLTRIAVRFFAALLGLGLLVYLVFRAGPGVVWKQVHTVGWGFSLIIILGGLSQLIRTCAWRQTITYDIKGLRWSRSIGVQLASDACGQLGFAGKMVGEGIRVSLLSPVVPADRGISSCAIDGGMHLLTAAVVAVLGITITLLHFPLSGQWRVYALLLAAVLIALVVLAAVAVASRWQLMGNAARAIGRLPQLHNWVIGKEPTIDSAEHNLLNFQSQSACRVLGEPHLQSPMARAGSVGGLCHLAVHGSRDRLRRRLCAGRADEGDQPRRRAESR